MSNDNTESHWIVRAITSLSVVAVLAGAVWMLSDEANGAAEPVPTVATVATSCSRFNADARQHFQKSGATELTGTFAAGDHVHLVVDLKGAYAWKVNGALGKKPEVESTGPLTFTYSYTLSNVTLTRGSNPPSSTTSVMSRGTVKGFARFDLELDVENAGEGTITISRTGSAVPFLSPRVAVASCKAASRPARTVS